ncbi:MAG TPA: NADH-quinone oxidoreductase subunit J [Chitinophagaceae bacterium]|nr:NADH-quinone oxidoreductase subunit J [Chitinophagaceae bacterium]
MTAYQVSFYLISACLLGTALLAVTTRNLFRAAIWLLFSLVGVAALYFWMQVEFIAAVQIVVYVGGIVVLILFSVFLTQQTGQQLPRATRTRRISSLLAALAGLVLCWLLIRRSGLTATGRPFHWDMHRIGSHMLGTGDQGYALPFEVVSILLLAALVGCIAIALKSPSAQDNNQNPEDPA